MENLSCNIYAETLPMEGGRYKVLFYRNGKGACSKQEATEVIVHYHSVNGTLIHCEYQKL